MFFGIIHDEKPTASPFELRLPNNHAAFHHELRLSQCRYIFCWVAVDGHKIGEQAGADAAAIVEMKNGSVSARGLSQNFDW